jgi:hypothetical protein
MSAASSARERTTTASPSPTSPESSSRRTSRDPAANSVAVSSPNETTRRRRGNSQIERGSEDSGDLVTRRFGCHQTCESALLHTRRYRHHHRLLVVDALDPCGGACYCLDVPRSTLPQSTFVCLSVVDAPPCSSTVLSCGWWSVDVDATVSVQRAAAMSDVGSACWCCTCLDVSLFVTAAVYGYLSFGR